MEAISNHAKRARADEQARRMSQSELESHVGVTSGRAYLVNPGEDDDHHPVNALYIMEVRDIRHYDDDNQFSSGEWYRPHGLSKGEFVRGIVIDVDIYRVNRLDGIGIFPEHDPVRSASLYSSALSQFPRHTLDPHPQDDNGYLYPSGL